MYGLGRIFLNTRILCSINNPCRSHSRCVQVNVLGAWMLFIVVLQNSSRTALVAWLSRCITDWWRAALAVGPVYNRNIYLLVQTCLPDTVLSCLVDRCLSMAVNPARSSLRSATSCDLTSTRRNLILYGQCNFCPRTCKQHPPDIWDPSLSFIPLSRTRYDIARRLFYARSCLQTVFHSRKHKIQHNFIA